MDATFSGVQGIFELASKKLYSSTPATVKLLAELLYSLLTLLFYAMMKLSDISLIKPQFATEANQRVERMWLQLHKSISEDWIVTYFSSTFGDPGTYSTFRYAKEDIQVYVHTRNYSPPFM